MSTGGRWRHSPTLALLALTILATLSAWSLTHAVSPPASRATPTDASLRLASLAPAITETLLAIGAGQRLVAVSDYCDHPAAAARLPRVGTGLTPDYERLARLRPTLILTDSYARGRVPQLDTIGHTAALPWLTLQDVTGSIRRLGQLTGHHRAAARLAARMRARLDVKPKAGAPRVLLLHGGPALERGEVWFIKDNSLHGAALRAAGGKNAASEPVVGPAQMSLERLLELDPDLLVVLAGTPYASAQAQQRLLATLGSWRQLRAVREGRVSVLQGATVFATDPRILDLVERLADEIGSFGRRR
jgi:ABC-type Fe3+-hydroxamate transport system substrate-binding protein